LRKILSAVGWQAASGEFQTGAFHHFHAVTHQRAGSFDYSGQELADKYARNWEEDRKHAEAYERKSAPRQEFAR